MSDLVEVTTTLPTREAALELARKLVEGKIVACVQVYGPMTSVYSWKGQMHEDSEWKLVAKTLQSQSLETMEQIRSWHSYETPEILVLPVIQSSLGYEQWVKDSVSREVKDKA